MATLSAEYGRWSMEIAVGAGEAAALVEFPSLAEAREDFEKRYIWKKYQECGGSMSRTADTL